MSEPSRRRPRLAVAFVVALALVIQSNLTAIVASQADDPPSQQPHAKTRDIAAVTLLNDGALIRGIFRWYYRMRRLGAGTTVRIPPELAGDKFYLEEVARLRVEVDPALPLVEPAFLDHVDPDEVFEPGGLGVVSIALTPGATRYLVVRTPDLERLLVLSERTYADTLAWYRAQWPAHPEWSRQMGRRVVPDGPPFAWYAALRALGPGATLILPPELASHAGAIDAIAGVHVEIAPFATPLDPTAVAGLERAPRMWLDRARDVVVLTEAGATRYVLACGDDGATDVVMPAARYLTLPRPASTP